MKRFVNIAVVFAICGCESVVSPSELDFDPQNPLEEGADGQGPIGGLPTEPEPVDPALCDLGPAQIRLLTAEEYDNTVRDLFGTTQQFGASFPGQPVVGGFDNNGGALSTNERMVEQVAAAAEAISAEAVGDLDGLLPCDPADGVSCAETFIVEKGEAIFRRPLTAEELARYRGTFDAGAEFDFATGIEFVLNAMLQSPNFLYRTEQLGPDGRFEPFTLASRLSYFFWNSAPDSELLAAARSGGLNDDAEVQAQAERLAADPKARRTVRNFARQWLELDYFEILSKSTERYPNYRPELIPLWEQSIYAFTEYAVFEDGGFDALLTADYTFADDTLAELYGLPLPGSSTLTKTSMNRAGGILAQPALMALHATDLPAIHRGKFILGGMLCSSPPPPPDVFDIPVVDEDMSFREYTDALTGAGGCVNCHSTINPYGHALGSFDGLGQYRETDQNGYAVDDTVEIPIAGESVTVDGVEGLATEFADRPEVSACFTRKVYRYALGRLESEIDGCAIEELAGSLDDGNVMNLLVAIASHQSFTHGVEL